MSLRPGQWVLLHKSLVKASRVGDHHHIVALVVLEGGLSMSGSRSENEMGKGGDYVDSGVWVLVVVG